MGHAAVRSACALAAVALLAACGADRTTAPSIQGGGTGGGGGGRPPANPIAVTPSIDATQADSALIDANGGLLTARGANGVVYTLSVPPGALVGSTMIRMTPLASVGGMPTKAGLIAGVQFEPEGLRLLQLGLLTITGLPSASRLASFGYTGGGADFHLEPSYAQGTGIVVPVAHFSGIGLTQLTDVEMQNLLQHAPVSDEAWLADKVAALRASTPVDWGAIDAARRDYYKSTLEPALVAATTDATRLDVLPRYYTWDRQIELDGRGAEFAQEEAQASDLILKALQHAFDAAYQVCVEQHDLMQVAKMLAYAEAIQLKLPADQIFDMTKVNRCLRLKLKADISIARHLAANGQTLDESFRVTATLTVPVDGLLTRDENDTGPLTWASYSFRGVNSVGIPCTFTSASMPSGGLLRSMRATVVAAPADSGRLVVRDLYVQLSLDPGSPGTLLTQCNGQSFTSAGEADANVPGMWMTAHASETSPSAPSMVFTRGYTIVGGVLYAMRDYDRTISIPAGTITEHTHLEITHDPTAP